MGSTPDQMDTTLQKLLKNSPTVFQQGSQSIADYIERNISPELHKGTALKVFSTAVHMWGNGTLDASQKAADVTGVNVATVRRWAANYYLLLVSVQPCEVDDDGILSSSRGKGQKSHTI